VLSLVDVALGGWDFDTQLAWNREGWGVTFPTYFSLGSSDITPLLLIVGGVP